MVVNLTNGTVSVASLGVVAHISTADDICIHAVVGDLLLLAISINAGMLSMDLAD
jgi:hypothetical protein